MPTAQTTHHIVLKRGGTETEYGLFVRNYRESDLTSFSAKIASGDIKYSDGTVYQTLVQDDFSHGFGYTEMTDRQGYAYSDDGIDTRKSHHVMIMTKMTDASTMDGALATPVVRKFIEYKDSVYAISDAGVYKWDGAEWDSTGLDTGACKDALNDGDYLYVTLNGARGKMYDGTSWYNIGTATAGATEEFTDMEWMAMSGGYLWASDDALPYVHYTARTLEYPYTDWEGGAPATEGGTGDPGAIRVGPGNIPIQGLIHWNNALYIAREDGLWYIPDDAEQAYNILSYAQERHSYNFRSMAIWNGSLYFVQKNNILRMTGNSLVDVTPPVFGYSFPYDQLGTYRFLMPIGEHLYCVATQGGSGYGEGAYGDGPYGGKATTEVLLAYDGYGWHRLLELATGSDVVTAMNYTPTNDKIWVGINMNTGSEKIYYIPLQSTRNLPYASYETTTAPPDDDDNPHYLYTSIFDAGLATVKKHFSYLTIHGIMSPQKTIDVWYALDDGAFRELGTFDDDGGIETIAFTDPEVETDCVGKTIRFRINLQTTSAGTTPVFQKMILQYLPRPATIYTIDFDVYAADNLTTLDRDVDTNTAKDFYDFIKATRDNFVPSTLYDIWGNARTIWQSSFSWTPHRFESGNPNAYQELEGFLRANLVIATSEGA